MPHSSSHHWHSYRGIPHHCLSTCSLYSQDEHHQHLQVYWLVSHFLQLLKFNQDKENLLSLIPYNHYHHSSTPLMPVITCLGSSCFVGRFFLCKSGRATCYHQILAGEVNTENGHGLGSPGTNQETCAVIPTITGILYHQIAKTTLHLYISKSSHGINHSVFKKWLNNSLHPIILHTYKNLEL